MQLNRIVIIGRLARDPEERTSNEGTKMARFAVAVNRPKRNDGQEPKADFFNVVCFRQTAEFAGRYLRQGHLVAVEGRVEIDNYTDKDGNPRTWVSVVADNVQSLTTRGEAEAMEQRGGDRQPAQPKQSGGRWGDDLDADPFDEE